MAYEVTGAVHSWAGAPEAARLSVEPLPWEQCASGKFLVVLVFLYLVSSSEFGFTQVAEKPWRGFSDRQVLAQVWINHMRVRVCMAYVGLACRIGLPAPDPQYVSMRSAVHACSFVWPKSRLIF